MKKLQTPAARLPVYLVLVFLLTYGFELLMLPGMLNQAALTPRGGQPAVSSMAVALAMLLPTCAMLLTRLVTGEGFRPMLIAPNLKGHVKYYLLAWFGPAAFTLVGILVYFLVFPGRFDANFSVLASLGADVSGGAGWVLFVAQIIQAALLAPVLNLIFALGEEWGWRGYMMPKLLEKFSFAPACLIGGIIWGVWHAPITIMGHNYGLGYLGYPVTGILAMCCFCIMVGTLLTWLTLKTGSCLPAALAHGGMNGIASLGLMIAKPDGGSNPFVGPAPTGILGGLLVIVVAVICLLRTPADAKIVAPVKAASKAETQSPSQN